MTHRPRPRLSQHFLQDRGVIARIVQAVDPRPGEVIVEIGPGLGAITAPLVQRAEQLHVVEIDSELVAVLQQRFAGETRLHVHLGDALSYDITSLISGTERLRVVGNLPYHISTPLLFHLFTQSAVIQDMHLMLQRELARRVVAPPGSRTYGRLSVMTQLRCQVEKLFDIRPGAFHPVPKVSSTLLRLIPRCQLPAPIKDLAAFEQLVARVFSQRRKTLRNSLKPWLSDEQIRAAQVDPALRPEMLTLLQFAALANQLRPESLRSSFKNVASAGRARRTVATKSSGTILNS
ncbi:MAG: 16S rRNA (adenine(1518)-N(6)/adenine(1519)-N(6))-dimethyltransferase RsmA [Gammaproteobacteria bacterium]